jgi:hypothetical protein
MTTNKMTIKQMTTSLITISNYVKKFEMYPLDLTEFCSENKIELLNIETNRGQALALMTQPEVRGQQHLGRAEAEQFFKQIGIETGDAIQAFNKPFGLKRIKGRGTYCFEFPFVCDLTDIHKRIGCKIGGDRDEKINAIKQYWRDILVDVPNDEWQVGHLDPTIADATEANLAFQPPVQGKFRDRFKWDPLFQRMWPTGKELVQKMDEYYSKEEQAEIFQLLKKVGQNPPFVSFAVEKVEPKA